MKDINFNIAYGDLTLGKDSDLSILRRDEEVIYQKIVQVLKTNYLDYENFPEYGANLDGYLGTPISEELAKTIQTNTLRRLNEEYVTNKLDQNNLPYMIRGNSIYFRVIIPGLQTVKFGFYKGKGFKVE